MGAIFPASSSLEYCEACNHVTSHDASSEPHTCQVCAIRLISSVKKDS